MDSIQSVLIAICIVIGLFTVMKLFSVPIRKIIAWIVNTAFGFVFLALLDQFDTHLPVSLGFNLFNASVIGCLGIPGILLLILVKWIFWVP